MNTDKQLVERVPFVNLKGEVEYGLLRVVDRVPGRPKDELPREVCVSSAPQPKGKT